MVSELRTEQAAYVRQKKKKERIIGLSVLGVIIAIVVIYLIYNMILNQSFGTTYYDITSEKINEPFKAAVLSDLHCTEFGEGNCNLVDAIEAEEPDVIFMLGDMASYDDPDITPAIDLCEKLSKVAPTYYCYGNHEGIMMHDGVDGKLTPIDEYVEGAGAIFFRRSYYHVDINGNAVDIGAIPEGLSGYEQWGEYKAEELEAADESDFKILLTHHPDLFYDELDDIDIDLAFSGHYHGGLIRLPGIGGLYHPTAGFFPKYSGGIYDLKNCRLIVSRGLGNEDVIPRINNRPELIIVNVSGESEE